MRVLSLLPAAAALVPSQQPKAPVAQRAATLDAAPTEARDLTGNIPDCPATIWNADNVNIVEARQNQQPLPEQCPSERVSTGSEGVEYFREHSEDILAELEKTGCIWFRGFDLMKTEAGFRQFYEAVGLDPCLDPIHTSGLRSFASQEDAIYEEVNKESLSRHYIGLHQESTHKKTATYGAFVCFKPATVEGGEFFIADAAKIARDLDADVAQRIYDRKIRISVSNLDMDFLEGADFDINLPDIITEKNWFAQEDGSEIEGADHGGRSRVSGQISSPEVRHGFGNEVRRRREPNAHAGD